jgi:hypothetical protein
MPSHIVRRLNLCVLLNPSEEASRPRLVPRIGFHLIEGEALTPMLLARRFILNPVLVVISGIPGAILSLPMLAVAKIICDRVRPLHLVTFSRGERLAKRKFTDLRHPIGALAHRTVRAGQRDAQCPMDGTHQ